MPLKLASPLGRMRVFECLMRESNKINIYFFLISFFFLFLSLYLNNASKEIMVQLILFEHVTESLSQTAANAYYIYITMQFVRTE